MSNLAIRAGAFETRQAPQHQNIEARKSAYQNHDTDAVLDFCETLLMNSGYPAFCPQPSTVTMSLKPRHSSSIINCLRSTTSLQEGGEARSRSGKIAYTTISQSMLNKLYEDVNYQIVLRTLFELFHSDEAKALDAVVFNGLLIPLTRPLARTSGHVSCPSRYLEASLSQ